MLRLALLFLLLAAPGTAGAAAPSLQEAATAFAGVPVRVDERIAAPGCPAGYAFRWLTAAADQLEASCPGSDWRLRIPVAAPKTALPKRGEILRVEMLGRGYRVSADAVVETAGRRDGTLLLRNIRSGTRFTGYLQEDGTVVAGRGER